MRFLEHTENQMLTEAFDRPAHIRWNGMYGDFQINGNEYRLVLVDQTVVSPYGDVDRLSVSFQYRKPNGVWEYSLKKGSDSAESMQVLATVLSGTFEYVKNKKPEYVQFESFTDRDRSDAAKRQRLYQKLVDRYAKQYGYIQEEVTNQSRFSLINKEFKDKIDEERNKSMTPIGYYVVNGKHSIVSLSSSNAAAFIKAFRMNVEDKGKIGGSVSSGRTIAVGYSKDGIPKYDVKPETTFALVRVDGQVFEMNTKEAWERLLIKPTWRDDVDGSLHEDPSSMIGRYKDFWFWYNTNENKINFFYDESEFMSWVKPEGMTLVSKI